MSQHPSILKELENSNLLHIGGILSGDEPLCKSIDSHKLDLVGWISGGWQPNEKFCVECSELYKKGLAWKSPSNRE